MPEFQKSTRAGKKYSVKTPQGKTVHFGSASMGHYKDRTGVGAWSSKDHNDSKRRESYRKRSAGIRNKAGELTYKNKESANYYSYHYLW